MIGADHGSSALSPCSRWSVSNRNPSSGQPLQAETTVPSMPPWLDQCSSLSHPQMPHAVCHPWSACSETCPALEPSHSPSWVLWCLVVTASCIVCHWRVLSFLLMSLSLWPLQDHHWLVWCSSLWCSLWTEWSDSLFLGWRSVLWQWNLALLEIVLVVAVVCVWSESFLSLFSVVSLPYCACGLACWIYFLHFTDLWLHSNSVEETRCFSNSRQISSHLYL